MSYGVPRWIGELPIITGLLSIQERSVYKNFGYKPEEEMIQFMRDVYGLEEEAHRQMTKVQRIKFLARHRKQAPTSRFMEWSDSVNRQEEKGKEEKDDRVTVRSERGVRHDVLVLDVDGEKVTVPYQVLTKWKGGDVDIKILLDMVREEKNNLAPLKKEYTPPTLRQFLELLPFRMIRQYMEYKGYVVGDGTPRSEMINCLCFIKAAYKEDVMGELTKWLRGVHPVKKPAAIQDELITDPSSFETTGEKVQRAENKEPVITAEQKRGNWSSEVDPQIVGRVDSRDLDFKRPSDHRGIADNPPGKPSKETLAKRQHTFSNTKCGLEHRKAHLERKLAELERFEQFDPTPLSYWTNSPMGQLPPKTKKIKL